MIYLVIFNVFGVGWDECELYEIGEVIVFIKMFCVLLKFFYEVC